MSKNSLNGLKSSNLLDNVLLSPRNIQNYNSNAVNFTPDVTLNSFGKKSHMNHQMQSPLKLTDNNVRI